MVFLLPLFHNARVVLSIYAELWVSAALLEVPYPFLLLSLLPFGLGGLAALGMFVIIPFLFPLQMLDWMVLGPWALPTLSFLSTVLVWLHDVVCSLRFSDVTQRILHKNWFPCIYIFFFICLSLQIIVI